MEFRIERDIACIVEEKVELDLVVTGTRRSALSTCRFGRDFAFVGNAVSVLPLGRIKRQERAERLTIGRCRLLPIKLDRRPSVTKPFLVGIAVLRDDGRDPLGA